MSDARRARRNDLLWAIVCTAIALAFIYFVLMSPAPQYALVHP